MAGHEFTVATAEITVDGTEQKALGINAHATIGFIVHRVYVSFIDLSSETGKVLCKVHKSDGNAAAGTALTEVTTGGDADSFGLAAFGAYITAASEGVVAAKHWPVTAQSPVCFRLLTNS